MFPLEKFYRGEIFTKTSDQPNQQKKEIPIHPLWVCLYRDTASSFASDVCHKREIWKNHDFLFECKNDKTICAFFTSLSLFFFLDSQIFALLTSWNNCVNAVFFCYNWNISCKLVYLFIFRFFVFNQILQSAKVLGIKYRRFFSFKISFCFFFIEFF